MDYFVYGYKRDGSGPYYRHKTKGSWTLHKNQRLRTTSDDANRVADNCNKLYSELDSSDWSDFGVATAKPLKKKTA